MTTKANHRVDIVRIEAVLNHPNADALDIIPVGEYQCIVAKGSFKVGDLGIYLQPDSVCPQTDPFKFIWGPYATEYMAQDGVVCHGNYDVVPEKRRRITVKRLRKEYSEGLLLPVTDFDELIDSALTRHFVESDFPVGTDVAELLGVTHYDPEEHDQGTTRAKSIGMNAPRRKYPKSFKGWFYYLLYKLARTLHVPLKDSILHGLALETGFTFPTYDVDSIKNFANVLQESEEVIISEKIHGSNARYVFIQDKSDTLKGTLYCGSRNQWKTKGDNIWWNALKSNPQIENFCYANPGVVLYGEVTPTQGGYSYGTTKETPGFFAFDVYREGKWYWPGNEGIIETVPVLYTGPYSREVAKSLVDGTSLVPGAKTPREGIVIRPKVERSVRGLGRVHLKWVSSAFLLKDGVQ